MLESTDPVRYVDVVPKSSQTSFKDFACGTESCDCEFDDGTTETDIHIFRSLTPQEQPWSPLMRGMRTICMGFMMLILDANGAN